MTNPRKITVIVEAVDGSLQRFDWHEIMNSAIVVNCTEDAIAWQVAMQFSGKVTKTVNVSGNPARPGTPTELRTFAGENWKTAAHGQTAMDLHCEHDVEMATVTLRRIGWVDQKGRVYVSPPPQADFDGGSLTALLINPGCE